MHILKRLAPLAAIIAAFTLHHSAVAQTQPGFELGAEAYYYGYREPSLDVDINGPAFGVNARYTWTLNTIFLRLDGNGGIGYFDYSSPSGKNNGIWDFKGDFRGLVGNDFTVASSIVASPYIGLGYRILFDKEGGTTTDLGAHGYDRLSQYLYLPIGVTMGFQTGAWTIKPNIEFDYLIQGRQTSYLSSVGFDSDLTNKQDDGYGLRGSLMFEKPSSLGRLSIGPFVRYWNIRQSDTATVTAGGFRFGGFEPANDTIEVGLAANWRF